MRPHLLLTLLLCLTLYAWHRPRWHETRHPDAPSPARNIREAPRDTAAMRNFLHSLPDSVAPLFHFPAEQHELRLIKDSIQYSIDLDQHVGQKSWMPPTHMASPFAEDPLTLVGQDTLLGKTCQIYEYMKAFRIWKWEKIPVKKEIMQMPDPTFAVEYATEIDSSYRIKPGEFNLPAGIRIP